MKIRLFLFYLILINTFLHAQQQRSDSIVALVNNQIITYGEVYEKIKASVEGIDASNLSPSVKGAAKKEIV